MMVKASFKIYVTLTTLLIIFRRCSLYRFNHTHSYIRLKVVHLENSFTKYDNDAYNGS